MMGHKMCKCPHHIVAKVLGLLGFLSVIAFFWSVFGETGVFGLNGQFYFESVIIFAIMAHGTKMCGCCCGGMRCGGKDCGACMPGSNEGMGKGMDHGMCKHEAGCSCGDCDRCK